MLQGWFSLGAPQGTKDHATLKESSLDHLTFFNSKYLSVSIALWLIYTNAQGRESSFTETIRSDLYPARKELELISLQLKTLNQCYCNTQQSPSAVGGKGHNVSGRALAHCISVKGVLCGR